MKYHNIPTLFDNQASLINGKNIGTDSVRYIQDAGQKTAGTTYIDKNTNELYVCVTTTNSVNNDGNFSKFNLKEAFNKLTNLISSIDRFNCTESSKVKYSFQGFIINNDYAVISGTILAKNNASYQTKFPEKYRPKVRTGLSFPVPKTESVVATATVYLYPDGTVKTEHPYPDQICVGTVIYKLN